MQLARMQIREASKYASRMMARVYLWVHEDGRKYWRLCYKIHDKEKSLSLGVYPVVGLMQARLPPQAERVKLASNIDLSIDRQII